MFNRLLDDIMVADKTTSRKRCHPIKVGIIRGHGGEIQPLHQGDVERIAGQERIGLDILKHTDKICGFDADQMDMRQRHQLP